MLSSDISRVDCQALQGLCDTRCPEGAAVDFKRELPGNADRDRHEFLKDVCALANANGGDLVYGIDEEDGCAKELRPIEVEAADVALRRLGQILDSGIEPRIPGVQFQVVPCAPGYCLVLRVPGSYNGPHRYLFNNHSKFVIRNGTHTTELSYEQLRGAFDRTASLGARAAEWIGQRTQLIAKGETSVPTYAGPLCVVHVVPLAAFSGRLAPDLVGLRRDHSQLRFSDWRSSSALLNLDGVVAMTRVGASDDPAFGCTQVFRSGALEAIRFGGSAVRPDAEVIPSTVVTVFFRDAMLKLLTLARESGASGPALVRCALLHVHGYEFGVGGNGWQLNRAFSDRADLVLPDVWIDAIERPDSTSEIDRTARPILEVLWQAFGLDSCQEYRADGMWDPRMPY